MTSYPPWKDLPHELTTAISNFLSSNPLDIIHFRSVCKSFHSSLPFPSHLLSPFCPLPLPHPPSSSSSTTSCVLTATSIFSIRPRTRVSSPTPSSCNWVVFFDELNPGTLSVRRPFSKYGFDLPLDFPIKLYLSDFQFEKIGMFYNVNYVDVTRGKFIKKGLWNSDFNKVVVFGNGVGLVSLDGGGKLGFLRFGDGSEWRVVHDGKGFRFDDVVEFKGRVLGIDGKARVYETVMVGCDDVSIKLNDVVPAISGGDGQRKRLIESFGCLYLVVRMNCPSKKKNDDVSEFRVYVMDENVMKWVEVNDIGDRVFLFGLDFSVACDARKFEGLIDGNCMVINNISFSVCNVGTNWLMYSRFVRLSDDHFSIYRFKAGATIQGIKSLSSYFSLFWPPPTWIWPNERSKLSGTFVAASNRLLEGIFDDELKANYQELSFKIKAIVAGDGISQKELHEMLKNADMHLKFLKDVVVEVEKDSKIIMKSIIYDAEARRLESKLVNDQARTSSWNDKTRLELIMWMNYQEGISSSTAEDNIGSTNDEWVSNETSQRLNTHFSLQRFLNRLIAMFHRK